MNERRLYRSRYDKKLFGLCGGIGQFFGIDSTLVRIGVVLLTIFTGIPLLFYFLLALIVPKEPYWSTPPYEGMNPYACDVDGEIDRLEKWAMQKEINRLRSELAKYR